MKMNVDDYDPNDVIILGELSYDVQNPTIINKINEILRKNNLYAIERIDSNSVCIAIDKKVIEVMFDEDY